MAVSAEGLHRERTLLVWAHLHAYRCIQFLKAAKYYLSKYTKEAVKFAIEQFILCMPMFQEKSI